MSRLEHVIARNVIALRNERRLTQGELAARMRAEGFTWQTNRITQIETLRRPVSLLEVIGLSRTLRVPVVRLLAGEDEVDLPGGRTMPLGEVRDAIKGRDRFRQERLANPSPADRQDEIRRLASKLGMSAHYMGEACLVLYGHDILTERDSRLGDVEGLPAGSVQTKRGHATRAVLAELRAWFGEGDQRDRRMSEIDERAAERFRTEPHVPESAREATEMEDDDGTR